MPEQFYIGMKLTKQHEFDFKKTFVKDDNYCKLIIKEMFHIK